MELHEQLASPELCNQLHKLGVTAPSVFSRDYTGSKSDELEWAEDFEPYYCEDNVNAYSAAELGEILRKATSSGFDYGIVMSDSAANGFRMWLADTESDEFPFSFDDESTFIESNEADARAKMLIYLLENKLITP